MAGVGFALQRMSTESGIAGRLGAYGYSVFVVAGPWIITAVTIAGMSTMACPTNTCSEVTLFRSVLVYNFCASLILTAGISLPVTRYVSDQIYAKNDKHIASAFYAASGIYAALCIVLMGPFYLFLADMPAAYKLAGWQNVVIVGLAWLIVPFMGAMKDFRAVSGAFVFGCLAMFCAYWVQEEAGRAIGLAMLDAFNVGFAVILGLLAVNLRREFGGAFTIDRNFPTAFTRYWELALIGLVHYLGMWVDKLILWWAYPEGSARVASVFRTLPDYDAVMFWSQLTSIPILALFFVHVETDFYRRYRTFYDCMQRQASKREVDEKLGMLTGFVLRGMFGILLGALALTAAAVIASFLAIDGLGFPPNQMGMLRAGLVGVCFHICASLCQVFLLYFDLRRYVLWIVGVYAVLNATLTAALIPFGFAYLGFGQMAAAIATFAFALALLTRELPWLHFHAFITNNTSLGRRKAVASL
jgi:uncharacterized membrane protein